MLLLTIGLLIILVLVSYIIFDGDVLAPPTVVSLGLFFSSLCAFYNEENWGLQFSEETAWTIIIGVLSFIIGGVLAIILINRHHLDKVGFSHRISEVKPLSVEFQKTLLIILFELLTVYLLYSELRSVTGYSQWIDIVATFRYQTAHVNPEEYTMKLSGLLKLCMGLSFAISLIYSYIIGNNIATKQKQQFLNWIPVILSCVMAFMQGYRSDMLRLWIAILVVAYILKKRSVGWKRSREIKRLIRKMAFSVLVVTFIFVSLRGLVGRNIDTDALDHVTFYAGSSVAALDLFLKDPLPSPDIWGKETFYHLNQSLGAWSKNSELRYLFYKEFRRSPNGTYIGNIYTALRPPYYDFGFEGMILFMVIMGSFFTYFYCKTRDQYGKHPIDFRLLLYSYIAYTFFMYFYNLYNNFISPGFIRLVLELLLIRFFLFDFRWRY